MFVLQESSLPVECAAAMSVRGLARTTPARAKSLLASVASRASSSAAAQTSTFVPRLKKPTKPRASATNIAIKKAVRTSTLRHKYRQS